jgi:hypothetical protein
MKTEEVMDYTTETIQVIEGNDLTGYYRVAKDIQVDPKTKWLRRGFTKARNDIMRDTRVSCTARLLYLLLISRCIKHEFCVPSQATLAKEMGCTTRTVRKYTSELEDACWIFTQRRGFNRCKPYSSIFPETTYLDK